MASQPGWGHESASHHCPDTTCCSRPRVLVAPGYQTYPAVTILQGIRIVHQHKPRCVSGTAGREGRRGKSCPLLQYHLPMWLGSSLKHQSSFSQHQTPNLEVFCLVSQHMGGPSPLCTPAGIPQTQSRCTDHPAKQQSSLTVIPYYPSQMEPLKTSDIPYSQDSIRNFSTQGLYPTRKIAAKGPQELFSNNSWGEEMDYLQLTEATNSPANNSQQEGGVSTAFQAITGDRVGFPGVEAQSNFCKELLEQRGHPGDQRPSH